MLQKLESIKKKATCYIVNDYNFDYVERQNVCVLLPLSQHRKYQDIIFLYSCIYDKVDINIFNWIDVVVNNTGTRLNYSKSVSLKHRIYMKEHFKQYFTNRIVNL